MGNVVRPKQWGKPPGGNDEMLQKALDTAKAMLLEKTVEYEREKLLVEKLARDRLARLHSDYGRMLTELEMAVERINAMIDGNGPAA